MRMSWVGCGALGRVTSAASFNLVRLCDVLLLSSELMAMVVFSRRSHILEVSRIVFVSHTLADATTSLLRNRDKTSHAPAGVVALPVGTGKVARSPRRRSAWQHIQSVLPYRAIRTHALHTHLNSIIPAHRIPAHS